MPDQNIETNSITPVLPQPEGPRPAIPLTDFQNQEFEDMTPDHASRDTLRSKIPIDELPQSFKDLLYKANSSSEASGEERKPNLNEYGIPDPKDIRRDPMNPRGESPLRGLTPRTGLDTNVHLPKEEYREPVKRKGIIGRILGFFGNSLTSN